MVGVASMSIIGVALSPIGQAIAVLYRAGSAVNEFMDEHIAKLKGSENKTVSCTGSVLEGAKFGFGLGYMSSMVIIAVGQYLLGNTFAAIATVATGVTLTNPIAMTCAAVGAIYYGWAALSDDERNNILNQISKGLEMGFELIRSILSFVQRSLKDALDSKQLAEFKDFVSTHAKLFGRSLYDVTGKIGDMVKSATDKVVELTGKAADATFSAASVTFGAVASGASAVAGATKSSAEYVSDAASNAKNAAVRLISKGTPSEADELAQLGDNSHQPPQT